MTTRERVAASLLLADTRSERRETPFRASSRSQETCTADGQDPARERAVEGPVSQGARSEETNRDGWTGHQTRTCRECGEVGYPRTLLTGQSFSGWEDDLCPVCVFMQPVPRRVPGTEGRRHV